MTAAVATARAEVRWGDCDPSGIAFAARFVEWMDLGAHALARAVGIVRADMLAPTLRGLPPAALRVEYLSPALLRDHVEVRTRVARIGRSSLTLSHEVLRVASGPLALDEPVLLARATEKRVYVARGAGAGMRGTPLDPRLRAALEPYLLEAAADSSTNR